MGMENFVNLFKKRTMKNSLTSNKDPRTGWQLLPLVLVLIILDQSSKSLVGFLFSEGGGVYVNSIFNIRLIFNHGAAFSFLSDAGGWQRPFFIFLSSVISLGIFIWLLTINVRKRPLFGFSLSFVLGGAIGNLIDRSVYGYVFDFLDFHWEQYHWPVFNVADICISVGIGLLILDNIKNPQKKEKSIEEKSTNTTNQKNNKK
jgi:signal peptidase II